MVPELVIVPPAAPVVEMPVTPLIDPSLVKALPLPSLAPIPDVPVAVIAPALVKLAPLPRLKPMPDAPRRDRAEVADAAAGSKINACGHAADCFAGVVGETAAGNIDAVGAAADRPAVGEAATGLHSERAGKCTIYR